MPFYNGWLDGIILAVILIVCLLTLIAPVVRAFYHIEGVNEGWNAYNAVAAVHHNLYPLKYGWTTVNYPFLSFYVIGSLSRFLGDPVMIGRLLSLVSFLMSCVLVSLIVKKLTGCWGPAVFGVSFCLALFNAMAPQYIGADDPQMLAQPFFLLGLFLYLRSSASNWMVFAIVALLMVGGNIKHSLLGVPIALFIDLLVVSRAKAARFVLFGVVLLTASIAINLYVGGPFFISQILAPRQYTMYKMLSSSVKLIPLSIFLIISSAWAITHLRSNRFRVIAIYFLASFLIGIAFYGGDGVGVNIFFDGFVAISIIMGIFLHSVWQLKIPHLLTGSPWRCVVPLLILNGPFWSSPVHSLRSLSASEEQFKADVSFLSAQSGPAVCENLLLCFYAHKPYEIDPFNSKSLFKLKKLDSQIMVQRVARKEFGAIEMIMPATEEMHQSMTTFPEDFLNAVDQYYRISRQDSDCVIYIPR
jgi:hypothetical protein